MRFLLVCTNTTKATTHAKTHYTNSETYNKYNKNNKQVQTHGGKTQQQKNRKHQRYPLTLTSIARPVMTLCKSRARNNVVWGVGPGSYTTPHLGPSRGNVVFAGPYHRADTAEVLLKVFSTFRETVTKTRHLPTEVRGGGYHRAGM